MTTAPIPVVGGPFYWLRIPRPGHEGAYYWPAIYFSEEASIACGLHLAHEVGAVEFWLHRHDPKSQGYWQQRCTLDGEDKRPWRQPWRHDWEALQGEALNMAAQDLMKLRGEA